MNEEDKKAMLQLGEGASLLYKGAFDVFQNSKKAERIVFLYFSAILFGKDDTVSMLFNMFGGGSDE